MIHLYKRTILNDCEHFLKWFEEESATNERFKRVYAVPYILQNQKLFLLEQWFIVTDYGDKKREHDNENVEECEDEMNCIRVADIQNLIE